MKKILVIFALFVLSVASYAKRTYIPKYNSVIAIAQGSDTIFADNSNAELVVGAKDGMFRVAVVHEVLTMNRIKSIKAKEASVALTAFSTALYSASALSPDRTIHLRGQIGAYTSATLAGVYAQNASQEKTLGMDVVFENTSSEELMVSDLERGLVWFVQPNGTLTIPAVNPDVIQLRVSNVYQQRIHFVQAGGGSVLKQIEVYWEDEDYWAFELNAGGVTSYVLVEKATGNRRQISSDELKEIKRESKKKK